MLDVVGIVQRHGMEIVKASLVQFINFGKDKKMSAVDTIFNANSGTKKEEPYACPLCRGEKKLYIGGTDQFRSCKTCNGTGVVWRKKGKEVLNL